MKKEVYIAHPIKGNVNDNIEKIKKILREIHIHNSRVIPMAPYLVCLQYLDDAKETERALGIEANVNYFTKKKIDELWLCGNNISKGMEEEIKLSIKNSIPIICYNKKLKEELDLILNNIN